MFETNNDLNVNLRLDLTKPYDDDWSSINLVDGGEGDTEGLNSSDPKIGGQ